MVHETLTNIIVFCTLEEKKPLKCYKSVKYGVLIIPEQVYEELEKHTGL